jgi:hypothetical protein
VERALTLAAVDDSGALPSASSPSTCRPGTAALCRGCGSWRSGRVVADAESAARSWTLRIGSHTGEDRLLWPNLLERVPAELAPTVELMERQHEAVHEVIEEMTAALARWRAAAAETDRAELAGALDRLHGLLVEHLAAEEQHILPLASRSLTPAERGELGEDGMAAQAKSKLPMIFGMIMKDGDPEVIRGMLANAPLVPRLMLPFIGPRAYARYARRVYGAVPA